MKMNIIWKKRVFLSIRYLLLTAVGLIMVYPMIWMVGASFKASNNEIFSSIGFIPAHPTFEAYRKGWKSTETVFATYMLNTYKFVIPKVIGTVLSATITAYGFSRFQYKGKSFLFGILLSTLLLPQVVLNVPQFLMFNKFGWLDTYLSLVVPSFFAGDTYFVYMLIQFMRSVPRELEEAAEIDGCNTWQRLWLIMMPMVKPSMVSCALFQFMWASNDFMGPLIYINTVRKYPASLGLRLIMDSESGFEWNKVLALSVIVILPSVAVFLSAQNQFIDGVAAGGLKG